MRKFLAGLGSLALTTIAAPAAQAQDAVGIDRNVLHVQVILDKLGFGPGVLDGKGGQSLKAALNGFQESRGLTRTGKIDEPTLRALYPYRQWRPTKTIALTPDMLAGPFVNPTPTDYKEQAALPSLAYRSPMEKLAEMFHTTPGTLLALNSAQTRLAPGTEVVFPNALPVSRDYKVDDADWKTTLTMLNVDATVPAADHIVVDKSEGVLRVMDADDRLVAQFSATTGSSHDPLPIGDWKINATDTNPKFHYNPDLFWDAKKDDDPAMLPPGPNGPVGVAWLDLSKEHYGIHGTPNPELIGRTESHGCIRLTNWDVARLALMIKPGTKAVFQP